MPRKPKPKLTPASLAAFERGRRLGGLARAASLGEEGRRAQAVAGGRASWAARSGRAKRKWAKDMTEARRRAKRAAA